ncbi:hypothetical protein RHSIM_Rhsim13G0061700 [Rhododendron simsii]|uniref:Uncharacterized protein n=1 Tax=Rhododendron simsii TaxID=118357 RepID=A0A834L6P4_RHOSS|nr:hypothetical protein RHSIM_Rhsim13G0061700 [Rhododendron simsii]
MLGKYGEASGQRINYDKSSVTFSSNMGEMDKQLVCDLLDVPLMKVDARYLGLPSFWGKSKMEAYSFIVDKTLGKLQGWKQKQMSQGGKEIMLKSVTQAIPSYAMSCFLLPKGLCDKLNSYVSNFWWKGDPESRGIHWCSWDKMSKSKNDGGMGFRNFRAMNEALLALRGGRASWAWLSLLHGRELLLKGLRWQVKDGEDINFWKDRWVPSFKNFRIVSRKPDNCDVIKVADVVNGGQGTWRRDVLNQIVSHEEMRAITVIPLSKYGGKDSLVWHHSRDGVYSVRSGYYIAAEAYNKTNEGPSSSFIPSKNLCSLSSGCFGTIFLSLNYDHSMSAMPDIKRGLSFPG